MKTKLFFLALAAFLASCSNPVNNSPDSGDNTADSVIEAGYVILEGKGGNFCNPDTVYFTPGVYRAFSLNISEPETSDTARWTEPYTTPVCNFTEGFITFNDCSRLYRIVLFK